MEEVLVLVLQGVFEVGLEVLFYGGLVWPSSDARTDSASAWAVGGILTFALGAGLGVFFNFFFPHLLVPYPWLRIANLVLGPAASGLFAWCVALWRSQYRRGVAPGQHAAFAVLFTIAFATVRYAYAQH